jgi:hypothetical protein
VEYIEQDETDILGAGLVSVHFEFWVIR